MGHVLCVMGCGYGPKPKTQNPQPTTQYGFTLIELVLVALIIVILVGISTPLFRRTFYDIQLDETSYNITKFMNYARAMAIAEGINTRLNFDFETRKYWMTVNTDPDRPDYFTRIEGKLRRAHSVPEGVELEGTEPSLDFYPNGRSQDLKLYLKNKNGRMKLIEVKSQTGQADIYEHEE